MKSFAKHALSDVKHAAHGDVSGLRSHAKDALLAAKTGIRQGVAGLGGASVDHDLRQQHERINALHSVYGELLGQLKHQAERAKKTASTLKETEHSLAKRGEAMQAAELQRVPRLSCTVEGALQAKWEEYCSVLEGSLISPAKAELSSIFAEAEALYSSCLAAANELASQQGKERILQSKKGLIGGAAETLDKARRGRAARKHAVEMA